jgi:hypothetical protein
MRQYLYFISLVIFICVACSKQESTNKKLFYKNFNYITLKPIGESYDTLVMMPYVKVDTIRQHYLHLEVVTLNVSKEYIYEKYKDGWMKRDSYSEPKHYQFDMYDGLKLISYRYRQNPYKSNDFNLATVVVTKADYTEDIYFLGLYNEVQNVPSFDFNIDTSKCVAKRECRYIHKNDTVCSIHNTYSWKSGKVSRDTFCFLKKAPFEYFYLIPYEPFFEQIIK